MWNASENLFRLFDDGDFLHAKGKVQLFQGALQVILSHVTPIEAEKIELIDFLPHTEQDLSKLFERLRQPLLRIARRQRLRVGFEGCGSSPGHLQDLAASHEPTFPTFRSRGHPFHSSEGGVIALAFDLQIERAEV